MKYTLLEMVQRILESMDSDEVNSYSDTAESLAVANIIKECYYDIVSEQDLLENKNLFQLTASGDNTKPVIMTLPSGVVSLDGINYNTGTLASPIITGLTYVPFDKFLELQGGLDPSLSTQDSMTITLSGTSFLFKYYNDRWPSIWSSPDDVTILFDAVDLSEENTLTASRTWCYGTLEPTFTMGDTFVPQLDARQFQLLLQASKAQAFIELKQVANAKAEKKERRNTILVQRTKYNTDKRTALQKWTGFGRK